MTHERIADVEGGEDGQDWLEDAASEEPQPLLVEGELGGAQLPEWDPAELDAALAEVEREYGTEESSDG
jgi:hypothetical protein